MNNLRKTHQMVLIAAVALTMFSLLGSAAITGLIPSVSGKEDLQAMDEQGTADENTSTSANPTPSTKRNSAGSQVAVCTSCGTIVAILAMEGQISNTSGDKEIRMAPAYQIKLRMHNGTYQTITQHSRPQYLVGDVIRLHRRQATV